MIVFYLGHITCPGQLESNKRNVVAIERQKAGTSQTLLRPFLGRGDVYGRLVSRSAIATAPSNEETGKREPFEPELLTDTASDAFRALKKTLVSPTAFALSSHCYRYTQESSACTSQVGWAPVQK